MKLNTNQKQITSLFFVCCYIKINYFFNKMFILLTHSLYGIYFHFKVRKIFEIIFNNKLLLNYIEVVIFIYFFLFFFVAFSFYFDTHQYKYALYKRAIYLIVDTRKCNNKVPFIK